MDSEYFFFLLFVLALFALGALGIHITNQKKERPQRISSWIKIGIYFILMYSIFLSIMFNQVLFKIICLLIVLGGAWEILRLQVNPQLRISWQKFCLYFTVYLVAAALFCLFAFLVNPKIQLLTVITICIFDAYSQISGQMFGKRQITPHLSPGKTLGGLVGGAISGSIVGIIAGLVLSLFSEFGIISVMMLIFVIIVASFVGDLSASFIKRQYAIKDYSKVLPGHGGILDRFDSWIAVGAVMVLLNFIGLWTI